MISQRDLRIPPGNFTFDALERNWYNLLHQHTLIPVPNIGIIDTNQEFDCAILTGGNDSIARHTTENLLFEHARSQGKPIIGFCHGAFAVNDLTGGINGEIEGHDMSSHEIDMDGIRYLVNSYHGQCIEQMGFGMQTLATAADGSIEAFGNMQSQIFGIVWHPERMKNPVLPLTVAQMLQL